MEHKMELLPENWQFAVGRQNTVRVGPKWADAISPGDQLVFNSTDGREPHRANVTRVVLTTFNKLTDEECGENHAYNSRDKLREALVRAYGHRFYDDVAVSLIEFV